MGISRAFEKGAWHGEIFAVVRVPRADSIN